MSLQPADKAYHVSVLQHVQQLRPYEREAYLKKTFVRIPGARNVIHNRRATPNEALAHIKNHPEWRFICFKQASTTLDPPYTAPFWSYAPIVDISIAKVPDSDARSPICIQVYIHNTNHAQQTRWRRLDMVVCPGPCVHLNCRLAEKDTGAFLLPENAHAAAYAAFELENRIYVPAVEFVREQALMKGLFTSPEDEAARKEARKKRKRATTGDAPEETQPLGRVIETPVGKISYIYGHKVFMAHLQGRRPAAKDLVSVYDAFDDSAKEFKIISPLAQREININQSRFSEISSEP